MTEAGCAADAGLPGHLGASQSDSPPLGSQHLLDAPSDPARLSPQALAARCTWEGRAALQGRSVSRGPRLGQ